MVLKKHINLITIGYPWTKGAVNNSARKELNLRGAQTRFLVFHADSSVRQRATVQEQRARLSRPA